MDNIIEMAVNMVDQIPETNIYKALSTHFKNPLYAKRKEREFKPKFSMDELYKQSESTVNYKIVGDYKYVLTPYCLLGEDDEAYPILIKCKDSSIAEMFYFVDGQKYRIEKA